MKVFLCVDLGSSGAKAAFLDTNGTLVGQAFEEYRFTNPQQFWSEIDPNIVWDKTSIAIKKAVQESKVDPKDVLGISISMIGETIMALDKGGNVLYPAIESMDARNSGYKDEIDNWKTKIGAERIYQITSYPLSSIASANKILWLKTHKPELFDKGIHFATFQDFVIHKLTGKFAIDYSMASRTMLFNISEKKWSDELLSVAGISKDMLSEPFPAYHVVGELTEKAAKEIGLTSGIPVILGAHDQACASLGIGIVDEGIAMDGTGSVEAIIVPSSKPATSLEMLSVGHGTQCHVKEDVYLAVGFHLTAGLLVRWYKDQLAIHEQSDAEREKKDVYDVITENASKSPAGSNGVMVFPHFRGAGTGRKPPLNPHSKGAMFGLTLSTNRNDISRAVFEGITLETRLILSSMESSGISIDQLRVTGGGAKSKFWLQLKANITGKSVVVPAVTEASLLGAALLIGTGVGVYKSLQDATEKTVRIASEYKPDSTEARVYDRLFGIYQKIYPSINELNSEINQFLEENVK